MRGSRILLLMAILSLGASVETAYRLREHIGVGPFGWRVFGGKFYGPSHSFEEAARHEISEGVPVAVENAFGDIDVAPGESGRVEVALRKVVYLGGEEKARQFAERIKLHAELADGRLRVATNREELERESDAFDVGFETHLSVRVPPGTALALKGSHGRASVEGSGETRIENSFGEVRARHVGTLGIDSRHGAVEVDTASGDVTTLVRFGDTTVRDASGAVHATSEHGQVTAERTGSLKVELKQGGLRADAVRGDLDVEGEHADVSATQVAGTARVATTFEDVTLEDVGGDARVRVEHGRARCARIKGGLVAETSFGDAELADVGGAVEATVSHGGVEGTRLAGGVKAKAEGDDVVLETFRGDVTAEAERGSVRLVPEGALSANVNARARFGSVSLTVPDGSRFALLAGVERGDLHVSVPGLVVDERSGQRLRGRLGDGGGTVELAAEHGSVHVAPTGADEAE